MEQIKKPLIREKLKKEVVILKNVAIDHIKNIKFPLISTLLIIDIVKGINTLTNSAIERINKQFNSLTHLEIRNHRENLQSDINEIKEEALKEIFNEYFNKYEKARLIHLRMLFSCFDLMPLSSQKQYIESLYNNVKNSAGKVWLLIKLIEKFRFSLNVSADTVLKLDDMINASLFSLKAKLDLNPTKKLLDPLKYLYYKIAIKILDKKYSKLRRDMDINLLYYSKFEEENQI